MEKKGRRKKRGGGGAKKDYSTRQAARKKTPVRSPEKRESGATKLGQASASASASEGKREGRKRWEAIPKEQARLKRTSRLLIMTGACILYPKAYKIAGVARFGAETLPKAQGQIREGGCQPCRKRSTRGACSEKDRLGCDRYPGILFACPRPVLQARILYPGTYNPT